MEQPVAATGAEALDALFGEAWEVLGQRGSPVRLVLLRLAQGRPEDASARELVCWSVPPAGENC